MRGFKFSNDPTIIMNMLMDTFRYPGQGYDIRNNMPDCINIPDVYKRISQFILIAEKYGWYRYFTSNLPIVPEETFVHVLVSWGIESNRFYQICLAVNPQYLIVIDLNYSFLLSLKEIAVVCRKKGNELPETIMSKGIRKKKFPRPLRDATGFFHQTFNIMKSSYYIDDEIVTYNLARLKVPQVKNLDLPLYVNANPIVKASINFDKRMKK